MKQNEKAHQQATCQTSQESVRWGMALFIGVILFAITVATLQAQINAADSAEIQPRQFRGGAPLLLIDDFEQGSDWSGLKVETELVQSGAHAGRWDQHLSTPTLQKEFSTPLDASQMDQLQFWAYSGVANDATIIMIVDADDPTTAAWDYYFYKFTVDWRGWRFINIPRSDFGHDGAPTGWHSLKFMQFAAQGWSNFPKADTLLILDDIYFARKWLTNIELRRTYQGSDYLWVYTVNLKEPTGQRRCLTLEVMTEDDNPFTVNLSHSSMTLAPYATEQVVITITAPGAYLTGDHKIAPHLAQLNVLEHSTLLDSITLITRGPLPDHPRVFVQRDALPILQSRFVDPELTAVQHRLRQQAGTTVEGAVEDGKADDSIRRVIEAKAFLYLIQDDRAMGEQAIALLLDYLGSLDQPYQTMAESRRLYNSLIAGALVYDWCYQLLTPQQRRQIIVELKKVAGLAEYGWPVTKHVSYLVDHYSEDAPVAFLAVGIAVFDEDTAFFDRAYTDFFDGLIPARNAFYPAGKHHQGITYGILRSVHEATSAMLFTGLELDNPYVREQGTIPYYFLYARTPSHSFLTEGDMFANSYHDPRLQLMIAQLYRDPYLMDEALRFAHQGNAESLSDSARTLIYWDPTVPRAPAVELPLARYFGAPEGTLIARTGWDVDGGAASKVAMALMNVGEYNFLGSDHLDSGHFSLYYKGALATDSGVYEGPYGGYDSAHFVNYYQRTIAHNSLLILDPAEPRPSRYDQPVQSRDGGQFWPNNGYVWHSTKEVFAEGKHAEILAHAIDPQQAPDYAYLKGDLTAGYNAPARYAYPAKASEVKRSFVFLNLKNDLHPAALIIYDKVRAADAAFTKTWLLHSVSEPHIAGNQITITRTDGKNNGKLVNQVLLPMADNQSIRKIGGPGFEFWVDGRNYFNRPHDPMLEPGAWRIELSPRRKTAKDCFLNVLQVMDADSDLAPLPATLIESPLMVGTQIADRLVMFSRSSELIGETITFTVPDVTPAPEVSLQLLITDLQPGFWQVKQGEATTVEQVTSTGHSIYFTAQLSTMNLVPLEADSSQTITLSPAEVVSVAYLPIISK